MISKRLCQHKISCYCLLSQVIPGWWILTVCPLLVADSMQNSVCFADEGPKGTSKEILPLWFLLLGERKASLPWENQTLSKGRGSADHLHQKPHLSANALLPAWSTLQVALNKILSEPASLTTQCCGWLPLDFYGVKALPNITAFWQQESSSRHCFHLRIKRFNLAQSPNSHQIPSIFSMVSPSALKPSLKFFTFWCRS